MFSKSFLKTPSGIYDFLTHSMFTFIKTQSYIPPSFNSSESMVNGMVLVVPSLVSLLLLNLLFLLDGILVS